MTELLCRLFIKNGENINSPSVRRAYGTLASVVGIILNTLLALSKIAVGMIFGAISLQADGINNLSDAGSQVISFISFKMAAKPADKDHPFGHARIEYVASMIVSFIILMIGVNLISDSAKKIFDGEKSTSFSWIMIIVLSVSVVCKLWLCIFNKRIAGKIKSTVMKATAADSLSDAIATAAVLVGMLVFRFTGIDIDGFMGIGVAVVIIAAGIKILNETKNSILGERPDPDTVDAIKRVISEYPEALGIHDMMVHSYGPGRTIATLHVEVDGALNVFDSHDAVDLMEKRLNSELGIQATIHMDPIVTDDEEVNEKRKRIREIVKSIDERLDIHDFRFVRGITHTNVIFDVSVPFDVKMTDAEIRDIIQREVSAYDPSHFAVVTVDRGDF